MASSITHMAIAHEINKKLQRDEKKLLIGTIAPDISKLVGETRFKSHFLNKEDKLPNTDEFLKKYKDNLKDDFVLGYYIHLLVDYLWFKYFITEYLGEDTITKLDGTCIKCSEEDAYKYIYNDYTNLNIRLIDKYNLDLKIFYEDIPKLDNIITEIPMDKLYLMIDKTSQIIADSKLDKTLVFNMKQMEKFVNFSIDFINDELDKIKKYI